MAGQEHEAVVRAFYEALNARDLDRCEACIAPGAEWQDLPTAETYQGPSGIRRDIELWLEAFPDAVLDVTRVAATESGVVVAEYIAHGTNTGPLHGPGGVVIPPTNRKAELHFCDVHQVREGKIVGAHAYYDIASLLRELDLGGIPRAA